MELNLSSKLVNDRNMVMVDGSIGLVDARGCATTDDRRAREVHEDRPTFPGSDERTSKRKRKQAQAQAQAASKQVGTS